MWTLALLLQEDDIALGKAATAPLETALEVLSVIIVIVVLVIILRRR